ncbi:MAG: hypothetical protein ABIJ65_14095 [Chloroflexota bacterium]
MRTFEILILITLFVRLVGYSFPSLRPSRWMNLLPCMTMLLTVIHLVLEKFRWPMIPAYGLTLWFFLLSIRWIKQSGRPAGRRPPGRVLIMVGILFRLLIFTMLAALPILLPVFRLPEPTGQYSVGTTKIYLVDNTRPESFTSDPDDHRELMVQIWYPARVEPGTRPAPLMEHMPFQFSYLSLVQTHAYQDVPVAKDRPFYPVLIFSHGHVGFIEQNLTLMEELASQGYIVCSISHPYHTILTVFPDGRSIPADSILANNFLKGISPPSDIYAEHLHIWTDDTSFLMDELEKIQAGDMENPLAGKLDMTRIGILGQSFGGVTAVQVCSVDERCKAGISLDSGLPGGLNAPLKQPFMFMLNESATYYLKSNLWAIENTAYGIQVRGSTHFNFTDLALYSPVTRFTGSFGSIDANRMVRIINAYSLAFFNEYLKDEMSPLLDGPSVDYPEVTITIRNP